METSEAEKQLEAFTARANDATPDEPITVATQTSDEDIVEAKARQGRSKQASTVLQNRTTISETQLEKRIAATLRRYPDIVESELRERVADQIDDNDGEDVTEAEYSQIVNKFAAKNEEADAAQQGALVSPPPILSNTLGGIQSGAAQLADRASALPTPGGVGMLVAVLIFFIWAIIPISKNGKTRLQLLWGVLTNQVYFPDDVSGASGDFDGANFNDVPPNSGGGHVGAVIPPVQFIPNYDEY